MSKIIEEMKQKHHEWLIQNIIETNNILNSTPSETKVSTPSETKVSFKVINPEFLIKYDC